MKQQSSSYTGKATGITTIHNASVNKEYVYISFVFSLANSKDYK